METLSSKLIESTLRNLREHLSYLEREKAEIDKKVVEVTANIQRWEKALRSDSSPLSIDDEQKSRRKKGENSRILRELFQDQPGLRLTIQEAAEQAGLAHSSVQAVFTKGEWKRGEDNKWGLNDIDGSLTSVNEPSMQFGGLADR